MQITSKKQAYFLLVFFLAGVASAGVNTLEADRTKGFVVMGYQGILFELQSGEGAYLQTLTDLLHVNPDDRAKTIGNIRALSKKYPNIMDFAEQIVLLQQEAPAGTVETAVLLPSGPGIYSGETLENALNHLTRGMKITVFTKGGGQYKGQFDEYNGKRLWMKGAGKKSFLLTDILAIDASKI